MNKQIQRREFIQRGVAVAGSVAIGMSGNFTAAAADKDIIRKTRSFDPGMEYRRLGRTGLWISAVCMGGHWKKVGDAIGHEVKGVNLPKPGPGREALKKNRYDLLTQCMESGINYIDACTKDEISVYGPALKGRRDKMYLGFAMWPECPRKKEYCKADKLIETLEKGLTMAKVDYVDVWRPVASTAGKHSEADEQEFLEAFEKAKKQGKARFTGVSSHGREWLKRLCENHPEHFQVILFPYTASSKELPKDSLFDAVRKHDIGTFGIKPFGGGSLFKGVAAEEKNRKASQAIRYILNNPAITAPIPGLASIDEVKLMVEAIKERRKLNKYEKSQLDQDQKNMWANLSTDYEWLRDWEYI